jgi:hypothetical protein
MAEQNNDGEGPIAGPDEVQWTPHPSTNSKVNKAWRRNIRRYIGSGEQVFETVTTESLFVVESLRRIGSERGCPVIEWDCLRGFTSIQLRGSALRNEVARLGAPADLDAGKGKKDPNRLCALGMPGDPRPPAEVLKDPLNALKAIELFQVQPGDVINVAKRPETKPPLMADALFVFHNFYSFFGDDLVRQLFEHLVGPARLNCDRRRRPAFFVQAPYEGLELKGITVVKHWMHSVPFGLPDEDELFEGCVLPVAAEVRKRNDVEPPPELLRASAAGLRGLERHRADCELRAVVGSNGGFTEAVPKAVRKIAASIIASSSQMRLIPDEEIMPPEQLGGVRRVLRAIEDAGSTFSEKAKLVKLDPALGMALQGLPGTGKCLGRGTPVLMHDGRTTPVELVQAGDLLMGPDSKPRVVLSTTAGRGQLYRITPSKGSSYVVNDAHVLSLKLTGTHRVVNLPVKEYLAIGPAARERLKGWRSAANWPARSVPVPPYILGIWLGDGHNAAMRVTTPEPEVAGALAECAHAHGLRHVVHAQRGEATTFGMSGPRGGRRDKNRIWQAIKRLGLAGNKRIPAEYRINDRATRLELLAGLVDSDANLSCGGYEIVTKYQRLASDILFLARSLGFAAYVKDKEAYCQTGGGGHYHRIFISGDVSEIPTRVPRKQAGERRQRKDVLKVGIDVEPIGEGEYFGFELDGDHLFLLGDFTVTHNSTIAKVAAEIFRRRTGRPWSTIELRMGAFFDGIQGQMEKNWYDFERREEALGDRIIFADEFDIFAGVGNSGGLDEARKALFKMQVAWASRPARGGGRYIIYAMNDPRGIPPEAFREGRIDDVFFFDLPRLGARIDILKIHFAKRLKGLELPLAALGFRDADWRELGERTENWLPGELESLVKRARNRAFRDGERALPTLGEVLAIVEERSPHIDFIKQQAKLLELREACKEAEPIDDPPGQEEEAGTTLAGAVESDGFQAKGMTFEED